MSYKVAIQLNIIRMKHSFFILFILSLILFSCKKEGVDFTITKSLDTSSSVITRHGAYMNYNMDTDSVYSIAAYTAKAYGAFLIIDSSSKIVDHGHCWSSVTQVPIVLNDNATHLGAHTEEEPFKFTSIISGLEKTTDYYIRSYVITEKDTGYNPKIIKFTTTDPHNFWSETAKFPAISREDAVSFSINKKGYIGIGNDGGNLQLDMWEYDPEEDSWTQISGFPGGKRKGAIAFVIGVKAYVGLGSNGRDEKNDIWEYSQVTKLWKPKAEYAGFPVTNAVAFTANQKGYVGLGEYKGVERADFYEYDPDAKDDPNDPNDILGKWRQVTRLGDNDLYARKNAVTFTANGRIFVGLGEQDGTYFDDIWEFSAPKFVEELGQWSRKGDFTGTARANAVGFGIDWLTEDLETIKEGFVGLGNDETTLYMDFWRYNPNSDEWTKARNFEGGIRTMAISFAIGARGFIGTGFDGTKKFSDIWIFTP